MKRLIALALILAGCELAPRADSTSVMLSSARAAGSVDPGIVASSSHLIEVANGTIEVQFASGDMRLSRADILAWVENAARAVADYHGGFPVDYLELRITPVAGRGVPSGVAYGYDGALIRLGVGRESTAQDLAWDWVLVHEMVHLAFPSIDYRHKWLKEGLATYVEPIARFQAGLATRSEVWRWLTEGLPHGLPEPGDQGLDYTPTWGRTYWGGALFCLLADLEIRHRTDNARGLQDALRAVNRAGDITEYWSIERALEIADGAVGVPVLTELYDEMKGAPYDVDLSELWRRLGVRAEGERIRFNEAAPFAHIRRAIVGRPGSEPAKG